MKAVKNDVELAGMRECHVIFLKPYIGIYKTFLNNQI